MLFATILLGLFVFLAFRKFGFSVSLVKKKSLIKGNDDDADTNENKGDIFSFVLAGVVFGFIAVLAVNAMPEVTIITIIIFAYFFSSNFKGLSNRFISFLEKFEK